MSVWDSDDLGGVSERVSWAVFATAVFTMSLRVYSRLKYTPRMGGGLYIDDFFTLGCLLVLMVFCILLSVAVHNGSGKHLTALSDASRVQALKWNAIVNGLTPWVCTLPKFAIILTLKRILNYGTKTTMLFWGLALGSQGSVMGMTVWTYAQCQPVAFQWDKSIEGGKCASGRIYLNLAYFVYIYSTSLDLFFALYPVPFVMRLNMALKTRITVAVSLSISWIGFAVSIYKFSIFPSLGSILTTDPTFPIVFIGMTHAVEGSMLMISTSLATLRPLYRGIKERVADLSGMSRSVATHIGTQSSWSHAGATGKSFVPSRVECYISTRNSADDVALVGGRREGLAPDSPVMVDPEKEIVVRRSVEVFVSSSRDGSN